MAICNQLDVRCDYHRIDAHFEFYLISTIEKYIPLGAKCLDSENGKIESIAFENGKSMYMMVKKGKLLQSDLVKQLNDNKLFIKKVESSEIHDYIIFRLFLYSLNNFNSESLSFNNLTGKFYIYKPEWMKKNRSSFTAININVDANMHIIAEAATFAKFSLFKGYKKINDYPKYVFANKNCSLKRVFDSNEEETYIKKGVYNKKAEVPFFTMGKDDIKNNKVYYLYYTLELLKQKYNDFISFDFKPIKIIKTIGIERENQFMDYAMREIKSMDINFVNCVDGREFEEEFNSLVSKLQERIGKSVTISNLIDCSKANIVLIHNKEFYEQLKYPDPYTKFERNAVIQCVTVEDCAEKIIDDNDAIINTIIKEIVIKNDVIHKRAVSLDNWASYDFDNDWIFGKEKDGKHYFIVMHPNGSFDLYNKENDFSSFEIEILNRCSDYLTDNKGKEKTIIASTNGNINVISRTNTFPLPERAIFDQKIISRSKESRARFLSGVVDINLYEEDECFYSVGIKGSGMNTKIIRAPHLYKIDIVSGENIMPAILSTLSTTFVRYKSFTVLPYPVKYLNEYILALENTMN